MDSKSQVWVIIFCETESLFESWLITVGVRRSFPPIDIRLISRSFVASFHICCLLSQRQHKESAQRLPIEREQTKIKIHKKRKKTIITDIQKWAKRELQFGWGTLIWFKISSFLMSLFLLPITSTWLHMLDSIKNFFVWIPYYFRQEEKRYWIWVPLLWTRL